MNWLVRVEVSAESMRGENVSDSYAWHKRVWECFPDAPESKRDFLTRLDHLEGAFRLWILSDRQPSRPPWCTKEQFLIKEVADSFLSHRYYVFDLLANPVKKLVQRDSDGKTLLRSNGKRARGKRVPLVKLEDLRSWIIRKGEARCRDPISGIDIPGGFRIEESNPLEVSPVVEFHFRKKNQTGYHSGVHFRGTLEVTDIREFSKTYLAGIGSAKGFGFGLLLLAPIKL